MKKETYITIKDTLISANKLCKSELKYQQEMCDSLLEVVDSMFKQEGFTVLKKCLFTNNPLTRKELVHAFMVELPIPE